MTESKMVKKVHKVVKIRRGTWKEGDLGLQVEIALKHILDGAVLLFNKEVDGDFDVWTGVLATDLGTEELLHNAAEVAYRLFPFSSWNNYEVSKTANGFAIGKIVEIEA